MAGSGRTGVAVRAADPADLDAVVAFGAEVVPPHYAPILGAAAAQEQVERWWTRDRLAPAASAGLLLLAEEADRLVGVVEVGSWDGDAVVWKLYVHPDARGRGVGAGLLQAGVLAAGSDRVLLEHFAGNTRAAAFYERQGFTVLRTEPSADGDPAAAVVWRVRAVPGP